MAESPNKSGLGGGQDERTSFYPMPPLPWIEYLRGYIRDHKEINILLDNQFESTDTELGEAWGRALMDFNATPPVVQTFSYLNLPLNARFVLLLKAANEALVSSSYFHARNELQYQDGNTSYAINDKWKNFLQLIDRKEQEYQQLKKDIKVAFNADAAYGGVPSEFSRGGQSGAGGFSGF